MNNIPETDLERRLAARLQPTRVPGAEQAWAQVAPRLGRPGTRHTWGTLATAAAALIVVAMLAVTANALFFPNGIGGQYGSAPGFASNAGQPTTPTVAMPPIQAFSIAPAPPFAVYQLGNPPAGMTMIAQSYRAEAPPGNQQQPITTQGQSASARAGAMAGGQPVDSNTVQAANDWLTELLNDGPETTLAIVYAASPDDLIGLVQRAAIDKILPAGEPVTVRNLPGIRTQQDGRTTITWIEGGTYIELSVSSRQATLLSLAAGLVKAPITPPPAIPDLGTPRPGEPGTSTTAVAVAVGASGGAGQGITASATVDHAAVVQQCGAWDATLHTTSSEASIAQAACYARATIGADPTLNYTVDRLTWGEVASQQNTAPPNSPTNSSIVWRVTFGEPTTDTITVILDATTGDPFIITGTSNHP